MTFTPEPDRYERMQYRRCGRWGLKLPLISLGLWQNFGGDVPLDKSRAIVRRAFDLGITHFDLANNYGPPYGSAEETFGKLMRDDLRPYRDELVISTKAGYDMWPGPYGEWGSRKYLLAIARPVARAHGARLRRHLLLAPLRPGDAARGDDGRARRRGAAGQGALRRHLLVLGGEDARGLRDPAGARDAAPDPPAVVLDAEPLDRAGPPRHARRARRRLHRLLAARPGRAHGPLPARRARGLAGQPSRDALARPAQRADAREGARARTRSPSGGRSRSRSSRSRGPCETTASPPPSSAPPAWSSSRRTSPRSRTSSSTTPNWRRSTGSRPRATSTSGRGRAASERPPRGPSANSPAPVSPESPAEYDRAVSSTPAVPPPRPADRRLARVCRVAVVLTIAGVFGTWRSVGPVSLDGFEGPHDGWLVVIFALFALAGVGSLSRGGRVGFVTVAGGAAAVLFTAASDLRRRCGRTRRQVGLGHLADDRGVGAARRRRARVGRAAAAVANRRAAAPAPLLEEVRQPVPEPVLRSRAQP